MGRAITDEKIIRKFKRDVDILLLDHSAVASKMKINKSSFSKYYNSIFPLTDIFLKKFYAVFEEQLKELWKKQAPAGQTELIDNNRSDQDEIVSDLIKRYDALSSNLDRLIENYQQLFTKLLTLSQKLDGLEELIKSLPLGADKKKPRR